MIVRGRSNKKMGKKKKDKRKFKGEDKIKERNEIEKING